MTLRLPIATVALALLLVATTSCTETTSPPTDPPPETWVVQDVQYSGPRGQNGPGGTGEHFVTCVLTSNPDRWKEITISAEQAYSDDVDEGTPCPPGPVRMSSDDDQ